MAMRHALAGAFAGLALLVATTGTAVAAGADRDAGARTLLDSDTLLTGAYRRSVDLSAYAPPADALPPTHRFEGRLRLSGQPATRTLLALDDFLGAGGAAAGRTLPQDLDIAFVQEGAVLLPARRGPIASSHPWWEFVLEAGRAWDEPGDDGWTRAAIPFALVQRNANCTHNGVLMLLFKDGGAVSRAAMQVSSETCHYLQLDMWGLLDATYVPETVPGRAELVAAHVVEAATRMPVRPMSALATDHPGIDPTRFAIGATRGRTVHGVVVGGTHYRSGCNTRHGTYPYCDAMAIPSYSVAKSAVAGIALMRMERLHPGVADLPVRDVARASGCRAEKWEGVRFHHLLDMATGQYDAPAYMADEDDAKVRGFFAPDTHAQRLAFACDAYPRRAAPGARWVYHTSDTYLLGTVLQDALRRWPGRAGDDLFDDVLWADVFAPLALSPTARATRRSYDDARQPLSGFGLTLLSDDIAKLARFLGEGRGRIDGHQLLDPVMFEAAMQRDPGRRGLQVATLERYRYQHGFWARNLQAELGCAQPAWVPFMSGFGGISVAMFANGVAWYNVADDGLLASIDFAAPAVEAAKLGPICSDAAPAG
ncbi:serine hydrolase [Luteimonas sp. MC1572]|uniref:serine hydrolase n=1 Tax=Luteimonas sp. MC1572 TaxID=2799325 RepID=UPI0018F0673B|nr:serine hydrolase [Luteimonas sp. MC1572]MBJ6981871.1 serine hydrolase [Luteimonas sp. MC1572]QQO03149.1 serine hydrolase [Luteimonas sp. MC1572]